ncbi:MAG TPA: efflux RND transporter periplasmic adaptor subunit [Fimbriiglobus sp.]
MPTIESHHPTIQVDHTAHVVHVVSGRSRRRLVVGGLVGLAIVGGLVGAGVMSGFLPDPLVAGDPSASGHGDLSTPPTLPTVKCVNPRRDPSVQVTVEPLATVEPYYQADLRARASGLVTSVHKEIGDRVHRGDLLVEIDVPDLMEDVIQKQAVVAQRMQELRVSRAHQKDAEAGVEVAKATIKEKVALVGEAEATRDYKVMLLKRIRKIESSIPPGTIAEQERDTASSEAAVHAAEAAVERARADDVLAGSRIVDALADIDLKVALVEVARRDVDRARVVAGFAHIVSPFDGVVVQRTVDPGSFIQNATTGSSEPLISVARTDIVTIVAKVPDSAAPYVTTDTGVEVRLNSMPGVSILGRITRYSPLIQNNDRTMRVEVDFFNGSESDYHRYIGRLLGAAMAPLAATNPLEMIATDYAGKERLAGLHKGDGDLPTRISLAHTAAGNGPRRLIPGMTGTMTLSLRQFRGGAVLPSSAVYTRIGKPYVLVVENGVTKQYPVQVQVNDGRVAKVALVTRQMDADGKTRDSLTELTGREIVVVGRQLELGEGTKVHPVVSKW